MHITNRDYLFQPFVLNDIGVVELLIEFRYKYDDNLFLNNGSALEVTGTKAINQEVVATYISLDTLIKQCGFNEKQMKMLKMIEQGYTHREIADVVKVEFQNVKKALKSIYKAIVKENDWQWRKVEYTTKLGLRSKTCVKCREELPATNEFYTDKFDAKDKLHPYCKKCKK